DTASILARVGPNAGAALPVLMSVLGQENLGVRRSGSKKFWPAKTDPKVWVSALIEALRHDHSIIRARAAAALGQLGPAATPTVPSLEKATKDKAKLVREAAIAALKQIDPEAAKAMPSSAAEKAALDALVRFNKEWKPYTNEPNLGDTRWKLKMETLVRLAQ